VGKMAISTNRLHYRHFEYKQRQDKWNEELDEFSYIIKINSLESGYLNTNPIILGYKENFFQTLLKVREYFKDINEQLFLDNAVIDLENGKNNISYEWFENVFLKDVEKVFNIIYRALKKMETIDLKPWGIVLTNPYGKSEMKLKLEKYFDERFRRIENIFDKLEKEYFHKRTKGELKKRKQFLYCDLTRRV
jgi:hypothetical protein